MTQEQKKFLDTHFPDLANWLEKIAFQEKRYIHVTGFAFNEEEACSIRLKVYSFKHEYTILAIQSTIAKPKGYLGAVCSLRTPYTGEKHTRGKDLADGAYTEETWISILQDIVKSELEELYSSDNITPNCDVNQKDLEPIKKTQTQPLEDNEDTTK